MFVYEKKLQYPVKIKNTNPKLAAIIISQYGGPNSNKLYKEAPSRCLFSYFTSLGMVMSLLFFANGFQTSPFSSVNLGMVRSCG